MAPPTAHAGVSVDCFGTLVAVDRRDDPATAVAEALRRRGIAVPDDWATAYTEPQRSIERGREYSLVEHVRTILTDRTETSIGAETVREVLQEAFDGPVETRHGAVAAVEAAAAAGPVGICSNCAVPGLVERTLSRSDIDTDLIDATVTSVECGWRKPDQRAFDAVAEALGIETDAMLHVGDDPATDGAAPNSVLVTDVSLTELATRWRDL